MTRSELCQRMASVVPCDHCTLVQNCHRSGYRFCSEAYNACADDLAAVADYTVRCLIESAKHNRKVAIYRDRKLYWLQKENDLRALLREIKKYARQERRAKK